MASQGVIDRCRSADRVVAAAEMHAPRIASSVGEMALHFDADPDALDFERATLALGRMVAVARDRMVAADEANDAALQDDAPARSARDEAARTLRAELTELKAILHALYGSVFANSVWGGGAPEDPVALMRFTAEFVQRLRRQPFPASRVAGAKVDVDVACAHLGELVATLDDAAKQVRLERPQGQVSDAARANAIAQFDFVFTAVAAALEGLLELASERSVAASIRPSRHRPGVTASVPPEPPALPLDVT